MPMVRKGESAGYTFDHQGQQFDPDGQVEVGDSQKHNQEVGRAEMEYFMTEKPSRFFAYVKSAAIGQDLERRERWSYPIGTVTTWTGETLGEIVWHGAEYKTPAFGTSSTRQNLRIEAVNGLIYSAVYYKSSGDYCRMKVISGSKRKADR